MNTKIPPGRANDQLMDEAEDLIWAFLDERLEQDDVQRLEKMIEENELVRLRYLHCSQVHASLYEQYQASTLPGIEDRSPVLGSLGDFSMPLGNSSSLMD